MSEEVVQVTIDKIDAENLQVPILGTSPLIMSRFTEKAKQQMLDAQQGRKRVKETRDPEADYEAAFYRTKEGYGFPAVGFKAATVSAARLYDKSVTMTMLRQAVFIRGVLSDADPQPLVPITGEPRMREDVVRVQRGTDLRFRPEFVEWSCVLDVTYIRSMLSRKSVLSLIDAAGMGVGVGEWRPEKSGDFGTFRIDPTGKVEVVS